MHTREEKMVSQRKPQLFSEKFKLSCEKFKLSCEKFKLSCETSELEKSDGLVHCSVENAAVLCENHRESHANLN